jgi:PAS domain S-box-containing protein
MSQLVGRIGLTPHSQTLPLSHVVLSVLLVSAGYYAGGIVGILLEFPPSGIAAIWPPTAILLAALLLTPPRCWWIYLLAVLPTHLHLVANFWRPDVPFVVMLGQVASNALQAVLAALAVRFVIGAPPRFDSLRNMAAFILLAGIAATAVARALVVSLFLLTGWATDFWLAWRQQVLANVFAIITIPPAILLTFAGQLVGTQHAPRRSYAELGLLVIGLVAVGIAVFGWESPGAGNVPVLLLAPLPFLLWAAVRLGTGALSLSLLIVAGVSLASAYVGRGPFVADSPAENVLSLQIFLIAIAIPLMLLAALVEERRRAEESLKQTEARMAVAAASTDTGLWQYDVPSRYMWATAHCRSMFGLAADSLLTPKAFLGTVHPDDRAMAIAAMRAAASAGETARRIEFRVNHPSGQLRWYLATAHTEFDAHGEPIRVSGIFRDVTPRRKAEQEAEQLSERLLALQEEERQRIADELHDSTAQHLVAASLNVMALKADPSSEAQKLKLWKDIETSLEEATKELRALTYLLHPPQLQTDGLRSTLRRYIDGFGRRTGLKTKLRSSRSADQLPLPLQRSMLRIVQEALANVHRHAAATRVSVNLKCLADRVHLVVRDDGCGIKGMLKQGAYEPLRTGVGIPGMRARLRQLGGDLKIRTGSRGTTLHAMAPIGTKVVSPA